MDSEKKKTKGNGGNFGITPPIWHSLACSNPEFHLEHSFFSFFRLFFFSCAPCFSTLWVASPRDRETEGPSPPSSSSPSSLVHGPSQPTRSLFPGEERSEEEVGGGFRRRPTDLRPSHRPRSRRPPLRRQRTGYRPRFHLLMEGIRSCCRQARHARPRRSRQERYIYSASCFLRFCFLLSRN